MLANLKIKATPIIVPNIVSGSLVSSSNCPFINVLLLHTTFLSTQNVTSQNTHFPHPVTLTSNLFKWTVGLWEHCSHSRWWVEVVFLSSCWPNIQSNMNASFIPLKDDCCCDLVLCSFTCAALMFTVPHKLLANKQVSNLLAVRFSLQLSHMWIWDEAWTNLHLELTFECCDRRSDCCNIQTRKTLIVIPI